MSEFNFHGMKVIAHPLLEGFRLPVRKYKMRKWQTYAQADRIQKRWNSRYGTTQSAIVIQHHGIAFMPPSSVAFIRGLGAE